MNRVVLFTLALALTPVSALAVSDEEICAEARQRFSEMAGHGPDQEPQASVLMFKERFCPGRLSVKKGALVRFFNVDKRSNHDIILQPIGKEDSPRLFPGETFDVIADMPPGDYPYFCSPHRDSGMKGTLSIKE